MLQLFGVKNRAGVSTDTSVPSKSLPSNLPGYTVTALDGCVSKTTVYVAELPSSMVSEDSEMVTPAVSVGVPVPEGDHSPSPSALVARTCTSYDVFATSAEILRLVLVTFCGPLVKFPVVPWR